MAGATSSPRAPLVSAALIVRDEADHLRRCLASLDGLVDEIVVVDTGSSDESMAVAADFGARVLQRPWDGDFSAPRNLGLDHVNGDWVLYIDADERVAEGDIAALRRELTVRRDAGDHVAFRVRLRATSGFTPYWEYRLWRNRPDIRFRGIIHETHLVAIRAIAEREHLAIGHLELFLDHAGYEGDQTTKHHRNLPLLEAQIEADPQRTYLWDHKARIHAALGDEEAALAAWRHAVDIVRRRGVREQVDCLCFLDLLFAGAAAGRPDPELAEEADALFGDNVLILWATTFDAIARGDHASVVARIDRLLAVDPEETARHALTIHERLLADWPFHARGMARFQLGDFAGAAADFAAAERVAPGVVEYRVKRQLAEARCRET